MEWQSDLLAKSANALISLVNSLRFKKNPNNDHYMDYANLQSVINYGTELLAAPILAQEIRYLVKLDARYYWFRPLDKFG